MDKVDSELVDFGVMTKFMLVVVTKLMQLRRPR